MQISAAGSAANRWTVKVNPYSFPKKANYLTVEDNLVVQEDEKVPPVANHIANVSIGLQCISMPSFLLRSAKRGTTISFLRLLLDNIGALQLPNTTCTHTVGMTL